MTTTFERFTETVKAEMSKMLDGYEITEQTVTKLNDITLHGLTARRKGNDTAPTLYLEGAYEAYCNGDSIKDIVTSMVNVILQSEPIAPITKAAELDMSIDNIREKLTARLIDPELNQEYLKTHPYGYSGAGLVLVADINISEDYRIVITNEMAEQYGLNMSEVFAIAIDNMEHRYPAILTNLEDALFGSDMNILDGNGELGSVGTLMASGTSGYGAIAIAYKGIADRIRDLIGDYYILPSSLHELIILRDSGEYNIADLKSMVTSANKTVVDDTDVLSNSVFHFGEYGMRRVA